MYISRYIDIYGVCVWGNVCFMGEKEKQINKRSTVAPLIVGQEEQSNIFMHSKMPFS